MSIAGRMKAAFVVMMMLAMPVQASAQAEEYLDPDPTVHLPIPANTERGVLLQLEGGDKLWGIRPKAKYLDELLPNLRIKVWGTCEQRPQAYCLKVSKGETPNGVLGYATYYFSGRGTQENPLEIILNEGEVSKPWYDKEKVRLVKRSVVIHELMHVIGFFHHSREHGAVAYHSWEEWLSRAEIREALRYYG